MSSNLHSVTHPQYAPNRKLSKLLHSIAKDADAIRNLCTEVIDCCPNDSTASKAIAIKTLAEKIGWSADFNSDDPYVGDAETWLLTPEENNAE